jgi:arylsulfatase A-like enzyme
MKTTMMMYPLNSNIFPHTVHSTEILVALSPPHGHHYERGFYKDGKGDEKNAKYRANADDTKGAAQTWHSELPTSWHNSTWTADRAIDWIKDHGNDKPFCSWVSFPDPHHPFDCPEPWSRLHAPEDVDRPTNRERTFENRPWWH